MSGIDPQRKKVAVLAVCICTLNMPFMLLIMHMKGSQYLPVFVIFYVVAMIALIACTVLELVKYKRSAK